MSEPITRARLAALPPVEAAALWRVQQDKGLPVEAGLFEEWLGEHETHRAAWNAVEDAWSLFADVDDPAFASLRQAALADVPITRWYDARQNWRHAAAAAAVLVVVVAGSFGLRSYLPRGSDQVASQAQAQRAGQIFETAAGTTREFALADGTRMTLASNSRVRVLIAGDRRQAILDRGTITLAVRHDVSRPFQVNAFDRTIVDIGTRYQVALKGGGLRVALFEGSVRVDGGRRSTVLRPNEQLVVQRGQRDVITRIAAVDTGGGELVQFDDVTLAAAADTINQGSSLKLVIPDAKVARLRISGRFRAGDPQRFAKSVSMLLSLRVVRVGPMRIELRAAR